MRRCSHPFSWCLSLLLATTALDNLAGHSNLALAQRPPVKCNHDTHDHYIVEHKPAVGATLDEISQWLGVEVVDRVGELEDMWVVRAPKPADGLEARQTGMDRVLQTYRELRDELRRRDESELAARSLLSDEKARIYHSIGHLEKQFLRELEHRAPPPIRPPPAMAKVMEDFKIQDPFFPLQWHIANDRYPEHMMNVTPVWAMGYTGKGVITGILDDGIDYTSEDLKDNFDAKHSYDFNDHGALPYPKLENQHHGTRCAGQIAAGKNNACGIGIAYGSKVAGIRILGGRISVADEAAALNFGYQDVSIFSCSWGPRDDGTRMQAPNYPVQKAVINGVTKGRGGKGSIFVFASGNGAHKGDSCNFDGYTNSIYSVTVGSVDYKGQHPKYSEACAANMIVAYSSGSGEHIVTTDRGSNKCALTHGGTSAAAPNVAAVIALALEARPDLTWRDIQHLCVETARRIAVDDPDWELNTATGRYYSYKYGYGVMDASRYVQRALTWKTVKPQAWLEAPIVQLENGTMYVDPEEDDNMLVVSGGKVIGPEGVKSQIRITEEMLKKANLERNGLEHITVKVWIEHTRRGDVQVDIVSPKGVKSILAIAREKDIDRTGFLGWTFMSVKHWGEDPVGDWTIRVSDQRIKSEHGSFLGWTMTLWGSAIDAKKAKPYDLPAIDSRLLPPPAAPVVKPDTNHGEKPAVITGKPTDDLPGDPSTPQATDVAKPDPETHTGDVTDDTPSSNHTWVEEAMNHAWIAAVIGFLILANVIFAIWFCCFKSRNKNKGNRYGDDALPMSNIEGRRYDDEEDGEATALVGGDELGNGSQARGGVVPGPHPQARSTAGLGFHSGFLDDDDPMSAATARYRDGGDGPPSALPVIREAELISTAEVEQPTSGQPLVQPRAESEDDDDDEEEEESEEETDEEEEETTSSEESGASRQRGGQESLESSGLLI